MGGFLGHISNIYNLIWRLNLFLPLILIFTILLLIWVLKKPLIIKVKINNFFIAFFSLIIYLGIYVFLLLYLRISLLGQNIDLILVLNKITKNLININQMQIYNKILIYLLIIILILLWFFLILKLRNLLGYKVWQLFMYHYFITTNDHRLKYPNFIKITRIFHRKYSLRALTLFFHHFIIKKYLGYNNFELIKNLIILTPAVILFFIFLGECFLNNFTLHYFYYYLPFYLLLILWIQASENISWYTGRAVLESDILIEMAYKYPDIIYVNLAEIDKLLLKAALLKNKKNYEIICDTYKENGMPEDEIYDSIKKSSRFTKVILPDGLIIFHNSYRQQYFEEADIRQVGEYYEVDE